MHNQPPTRGHKEQQMPSAEEILAQQADAYKTAPRQYRWQPPDGDYIDTIEAVNIGTYFKQAGIQILGRIQEGEFEDKVRSLGIFTEKNFSMLADVVEIMGGDDQPSALAAAEFLKTKIGTPIHVKTATRGEYTNSNIAAVIPTTVADDIATEDPEIGHEDTPE